MNLSATLKTYEFQPILSPLLSSRGQAALWAGVSISQLALVHFDLPGWNCPIREATGVPCPGCGLTRAMVALLHGDWQRSVDYHLFAPAFLFAIGLMCVLAILPEKLRQRLTDQVLTIEKRSGLVVMGLAALFVYWGLRLFWLGFGPV